MGTFTQLHYHLIWTTKEREALITPSMEPELYGHLRGKCAEIDLRVHALNGVEDHVHLVCSIPPVLSIAQALKQLKGASSRAANELRGGSGSFWQPGYGALTFAKRDLARIVAYVENQKQHHRDRTLWEVLERLDE